MMAWILQLFALAAFLFFIWFAVVSIAEKEWLATKRSFLLALIIPAALLAFTIADYPQKETVQMLIMGIIVLGFLVLLFPYNKVHTPLIENPESRYDERKTMFSRKEIDNNPEKFEAYYKTHALLRGLPSVSWRLHDPAHQAN